LACDGLNLDRLVHGCFARWPHANPLNLACARELRKQLGERTAGGKRHWIQPFEEVAMLACGMFAELPPLPIEDAPLPYVMQLEARPLDAITGIVIHCTELPDLATAREYGERALYPSAGTGNSGHYYIDRDGRVLRYVIETRVAHHVVGYNDTTVGIELVNSGRYPHWLASNHQAMREPYPAAQIAALIALLKILSNQLPNVQWIAGHEDLDRRLLVADDDPSKQVSRKRDPGPLFPWTQVLEAITLDRWSPPAAPE